MADYRTVRSIADRAAQHPAEARDVFLEDACSGDSSLRQQVEEMLTLRLSWSGQSQGDGSGERAPFGSGDDGGEDSLTPGTVLANRYEIVEPLGEGGMGSVWTAIQREPVRREVAIKLIKPGLCSSRHIAARFEAERQTLALMDHPNIAKVFDGGVDLGRPFFVMELVRGVPITTYCDTHQLSPRKRIELFISVCKALQHAHQKGIIHRDIKPSNVLVVEYEDHAIPKVIDFGIAKTTQGNLTDKTLQTALGTVIGTPMYMSPEQATLDNIDIDTRSDIYSLGIVLYELLAGQLPFSRPELEKWGVMEMLRIVREVDPPKPSTKVGSSTTIRTVSRNRSTDPQELRSMLRRELDWIVMKAIEKDRSRRYETANGLALDLQRYLEGQPVTAHPPTRGYLIGKFLKRHRVIVAASSLVALSLVAGILGTGYGLWNPESQRVIAEAKRTEAENSNRIADEALNDVRVALEEATTAKSRAEKAELELIAAYKSATDDVIQQMISTRPTLGPVEKRYLENAVDRWKFLADRNGNDTQSQSIRAQGFSLISELYRRLGKSEDAKQYLEMSERELASVLNAGPNDEEAAVELASVQIRLAQLALASLSFEEVRSRIAQARRHVDFVLKNNPQHFIAREVLADSHLVDSTLESRQSKLEDSLRSTDEAITIYETLYAEDPKSTDVAQSLAASYVNAATNYRFLRQGPKSIDAMQKAVAVVERLTEQDPENPRFLVRLLEYKSNLAITQETMGDRELSLPTMTGVVDLWEKTIEKFPGVPEYRREMARATFNLGTKLLNLKRIDDALVRYQRARDVRWQLAADFPAVPDYQKELASSDYNLGTLYIRNGDREEARVHYDRAMERRLDLVQRFPDQKAFYLDLTKSYAARGDWYRSGQQYSDAIPWYEKAIAQIQQLYEQSPTNRELADWLVTSWRGIAESREGLKEWGGASEGWNTALQYEMDARKDELRLRQLNCEIRQQETLQDIGRARDQLKSIEPREAWSRETWLARARAFAFLYGQSPMPLEEDVDAVTDSLSQVAERGPIERSELETYPEFQPLSDRIREASLVTEEPDR